MVAAITGGMAIGLGARNSPWIFLPLAFGVALSAVFFTEPWLRQKLGFWCAVSSALLGGATLGWAASSQTFAYQSQLTAFFGLFAVAALLKAILAFERFPFWMRHATAWLFVVVGMAWIVSAASSAHAGASGMIDWVVSHFHLPEEIAHTIVFIVRKSVHFLFYGFLGLAACLSARIGRAGMHRLLERADAWGATSFGMICTLFVATFDEARQTTQPGRTGSAYDVVLDLSGAAAFLTVFHLVTGRFGASRPTPAP